VTVRGSSAAVALVVAALAFVGVAAHAVESDPLPVPADTSRARAVTAYNAGVKLLLDRDFAAAQARFEAALALDERFAEAHNNLAFCLRMQSSRNYDRALSHYDRAIALKPALAVAYVYRGALLAQMGETARARADHARLLSLDRDLAAQLDSVIVHGGAGYVRGGVAAQVD
jgi:tetratricopeptide (TPR) repeat protein